MRVELRPMVAADAETFAAWAIDPIFTAHAGWRTAASADELVPWWRELINNPGPELLRLAAVHGEKVVGYVDLHGNGDKSRELGFVVGPSANWGRGWGARAAVAGLAYGFETMGLTEIWAEALEANVGSVRILERLGMTYIGPGSAEEFLGAPSVYAQYRLSRAEWSDAFQR